MIDPPTISRVEGRAAAVVHVTCVRTKIHEVMGPGILEVRAALEAQGVAPAGPWFTHHLRFTSETFDFEIGVPVTTAFVATGRITPGELPAATVARTVYHGGYEGLAAAWAELDAWVAAHGRTPSPSLWETYLTDPSSNPDPKAWRTELTRPLLD